MRSEILALIAAVAVALLSMVVYRLTPEGRHRGEDASGRGGSFVLGFFVRDWFYWAFRPLLRGPAALGMSPLIFNLLGVGFGVAAGAALATGHVAATGWLVLASGLADVIDGEVARARGLVSDAGAFLDSTLDRYSEVAVFLGAAWLFHDEWLELAVLGALAGSLMVSYTRARGESLGILCKLGVLQRAERMLLVGFGCILDPTVSLAAGREPGWLLGWLMVILAVGTLGTSFYRTVWITRRLGEKS